MTTDANRLATSPEFAGLARDLIAQLGSRLTTARPAGVVVGIAGESGSGKTVTAVALARELEARGLRALVLHQDDYFHRPPRANHAHRLLDPSDVGPHEVNLVLMASHVSAFRARCSDVPIPVVDYHADELLVRQIGFDAVDALVVEGTYVLFLDDVDIRMFMDATYQDSRALRAARARDRDDPIVEQVLQTEHEIIVPQAERAHIVIDRNFRIRGYSASP